MAKVITLAQIAELTGGSVVGDPEIKISSISDPRRPKEGAISPLWEKKLEKFAAGCPVLFTKKGWVKEGQSGVELDEPRAGLIALLKFSTKRRSASAPSRNARSSIKTRRSEKTSPSAREA